MRTHPVKHVIYCLFTLALTACGNEQINSQQGKVAGKSTDTKKLSQTESTSKFKEGTDYTIFERVRVLDRVGFQQPAEAFSLLLPKGWKNDGEVIWIGPNSGCDGTNQRFSASSPDGKFSFEMYPYTLWSWTSNEQLRQFQQSNGGGSQYCSYGEPMDAEQYLKYVFVPNELGNPKVGEVKPNPDVVRIMAEKNSEGRAELMNYGMADVQFHQTAVNAKLSWPGNKKGIALCGVSIIESIIPNNYTGTYDKSITTVAAQRVVFKYDAADEAQAEKLISVIMSSYRTNPDWKSQVDQFWKMVRQRKQVVHLGKLKMMDERTRQIGEAAIAAGNQRLKDMDTQMRTWESTQKSQDRMHTNFIKTIREVENYRDATGKIELASGYEHAWSRSDGSSFIMTNNPNFDPAAVFLDNRWKEMRKVD
ncbi:MAG: hypothetical protein JNK79_12625 [Chitinophagaceae bacterium]|nr:hypothetical protein [Chitinophagaceae bacterium]